MRIENAVIFLWFLGLFKPEWIFSFYFPPLAFIKGIPNLLLYITFFWLLLSGRKLIVDKPYLFFLFSALVATAFAQNQGLSRIALKGLTHTMLFYTLAISAIDKGRDVDRFFRLYVLNLLFYGLCGIAYGGRVPFHIHYSDEDAFGPLMGMGVVFSFFLAMKSEKIRYQTFFVTLVCIVGVVASFARGALLGFLAGVSYIIYRTPKKRIAILMIGVCSLLVVISQLVLFEKGAYWEEMSTIKDSYETDEGRLFLWRKAFEIFIARPFTGVGLFNYGFVLPRFTRLEEHEARGTRESEVYGRVPHNNYLQLMAEWGIIGCIAFVVLVLSFWRRCGIVLKSYRMISSLTPAMESARAEEFNHIRKNYYYCLALQGAFIAYLVNGLFYDLFYGPWLPEFLILNCLLQRNHEKFISDRGLIQTEG